MSFMNKFRTAMGLKPAKLPQMTMFKLRVGLTKNEKVPKDTVLIAVHPDNFDRVKQEAEANWLAYLRKTGILPIKKAVEETLARHDKARDSR